MTTNPAINLLAAHAITHRRTAATWERSYDPELARYERDEARGRAAAAETLVLNVWTALKAGE